MRVVHKFRLEYPGSTSIVKMDRLGKPVRVALQNNTIQLWAEVDPNALKLDRVFHIYATGEPIADGDKYVGTFTKRDRIGFEYVWHVYEA